MDILKKNGVFRERNNSGLKEDERKEGLQGKRGEYMGGQRVSKRGVRKGRRRGREREGDALRGAPNLLVLVGSDSHKLCLLKDVCAERVAASTALGEFTQRIFLSRRLDYVDPRLVLVHRVQYQLVE